MGAVAALIAAFALAAPATALAAPLDAGESARTAAQVSRYWTPKRMENAKPVPPLRVGAPTPEAAEEGSEGPAPRAGSIAYTSGELTDTTSFPYRVHGKVFFTDPAINGSNNFVCSGTGVVSVNESVVITAGHCVNHSGEFSTNFAFVPGYRNGNRPYGTWAATEEAAPSQWVTSRNFKFDVGAAVVAHNGSGQSLEDVVGSRGILFDQPVSGAVRSHGYPAQSPFDGSKLRYCDSTLGFLDPQPAGGDGSGPQTMGIGCDMTPGSSGGGWVVDDGGKGSVISLNSYSRSSTPEVMYGPYFGSTIEALYDSVEGDAPGGSSTAAAGGPTAVPQSLTPLATTKPKCKKSKKSKKRGKRKRCKVSR
jgi:V8-like Glu-specific endopeptidase